MHKHSLFLLATVLFFSNIQINFAQDFKNALSKVEIERQYDKHIQNNEGRVLWQDIDDELLWSTLAHEGDLVSIGYKPLSVSNLRERMHLIITADEVWSAAREKIIDFIITETQKKYGPQYMRSILVPNNQISAAPNFKVRVFDKDIIKQLRQMPEVRYFEPANLPDLNGSFKSASGCSSYAAT